MPTDCCCWEDDDDDTDANRDDSSQAVRFRFDKSFWADALRLVHSEDAADAIANAAAFVSWYALTPTTMWSRVINGCSWPTAPNT